jgi:N utilization substance protein A
VEIKAISRQPGERTKIAVWSKDEKVDSVGACVGMRGGRVKNIVTELSGEKIDIVRYNDDIREYIKAALLPAEVGEIKLDKTNKRAEVIVADDQLSLAIGKHGQNVRLASKLVGWELDVRTKAALAAQMLSAATQEGVPSQAEQIPTVEESPVAEKKLHDKSKKATASVSLEQLSGVGEKTLATLAVAGFKSLADIAHTDIETLSKVKGIAEKKAEKLIKEAKKLLEK